MKKIIILYIPVLHAGYLKFLEKYKKADTLYILGSKLIREFTFLEKEIRQINPIIVKKIIKSGGLFHKVKILTNNLVKKLQHLPIITADESISLNLVKKYFPRSELTIDTVFLRWDEKNILTKKPVGYDTISRSKFDRKMIKITEEEAKHSSDWWRNVGAVLVKNGNIILRAHHNHHLPSDHTPYTFGDPRDFVKAGENNDIATSLHAEQSIITEAAREGIKLKGSSLYATDFPCPMCARELSKTGIKKCYFKKGHASLNGLEIMKAKNIKIILVK